MELAEDRNQPRCESSAANALSPKICLTPVCASSKLPRTALTATLLPVCVTICRRWISDTPL